LNAKGTKYFSMMVVAVALTGSDGVGGRGSRWAVRWAAENLSVKAKCLT